MLGQETRLGEAILKPNEFDRSSIWESSVATVKDYLSVTKPRIMVLLLISTWCPMVVAYGGIPPLQLSLLTLLGGALMSGSASAFNCIYDRDIDRLMKRTKNRPLAAKRLGVGSVAIFATLLGVAGFWVLAAKVNLVAAYWSLFGHLFYSIIYTTYLKRNTVQNIVIGGAAGAVPPLVGWTAVTGSTNIEAFLMFLIIFLWTPPHFWALAILKAEEYKKAGVPMMPGIKGEKRTIIEMIIYAALLIPCAPLLVYFSHQLNFFSTVGLTLAGILFGISNVKLAQLHFNNAPRKEIEAACWKVFGYSLIYLSGFFAVMVVDVLI